MRVTSAGVTVTGGPSTTSRLTQRVTPGYSMGFKSVRQPEPGLRRVTQLAVATRLLGNSQ